MKACKYDIHMDNMEISRRNKLFNFSIITRIPNHLTHKVYTGSCDINETEHGSSPCTFDNPFANVKGLFLRTSTRTMLYINSSLLKISLLLSMPMV